MEKKAKEIRFRDNIEVKYFGDDEDNNIIYNIVYDFEHGIGLRKEDDKLIKYLLLGDTRLITMYNDGSVKVSDKKVRSIKVNDYKFIKHYLYSINGNLLLYNEEMAQLYNLNREAAYYDPSFIKRNIKSLKK